MHHDEHPTGGDGTDCDEDGATGALSAPVPNSARPVYDDGTVEVDIEQLVGRDGGVVMGDTGINVGDPECDEGYIGIGFANPGAEDVDPSIITSALS